ncbi:unnamed protein product, partial [Allacma fusca]
NNALEKLTLQNVLSLS